MTKVMKNERQIDFNLFGRLLPGSIPRDIRVDSKRTGGRRMTRGMSGVIDHTRYFRIICLKRSELASHGKDEYISDWFGASDLVYRAARS